MATLPTLLRSGTRSVSKLDRVRASSKARLPLRTDPHWPSAKLDRAELDVTSEQLRTRSTHHGAYPASSSSNGQLRWQVREDTDVASVRAAACDQTSAARFSAVLARTKACRVGEIIQETRMQLDTARRAQAEMEACRSEADALADLMKTGSMAELKIMQAARVKAQAGTPRNAGVVRL